MYAMPINHCPYTPANYKAGQRAECDFRYTYTGVFARADNRPATMCADCDDIQIKSFHATICHGLDIEAHCAMDAANRYAYIDKVDNMAFIMSKAEYIAFAKQFNYVTVESAKNGGGVKLRFIRKTKIIRAYLESQVA